MDSLCKGAVSVQIHHVKQGHCIPECFCLKTATKTLNSIQKTVNHIYTAARCLDAVGRRGANTLSAICDAAITESTIEVNQWSRIQVISLTGKTRKVLTEGCNDLNLCAILVLVPSGNMADDGLSLRPSDRTRVGRRPYSDEHEPGEHGNNKRQGANAPDPATRDKRNDNVAKEQVRNGETQDGRYGAADECPVEGFVVRDGRGGVFGHFFGEGQGVKGAGKGREGQSSEAGGFLRVETHWALKSYDQVPLSGWASSSGPFVAG